MNRPARNAHRTVPAEKLIAALALLDTAIAARDALYATAKARIESELGAEPDLASEPEKWEAYEMRHDEILEGLGRAAAFDACSKAEDNVIREMREVSRAALRVENLTMDPTAARAYAVALGEEKAPAIYFTARRTILESARRVAAGAK
jgi:hypothetical protein